MSRKVKYFGVAYYPEHWPEERWHEDARLMREAGFNVVRMAEFAWSKMEPSENVYDFDWLQRAIEILEKENINTVLGTPTAAAPAWLMSSHPEIYRVDEYGRQATFGNRQFMSVNAPAFRKSARNIVTAMASKLGKLNAVIGWQIDNEFGTLCYCETCRTNFQTWLRKKYKTLQNLNDAWGTIFWSQTYSFWDQIPLPWATSYPVNPGLYLDYRRFMSDCYAEFQREQIEILRALSPGRFITHNFMGFVPETLDYHRLARDLDFPSWDSYPAVWEEYNPIMTALSHDFTRGMKNSTGFWVMEHQSGPGGWGVMGPTPKPGQIREWTFQAIEHGAEGIVYFRWRPARVGTEQYWHGILNHDGTTSRRYEEIKQIGKEIRENKVPEAPPKRGIAILADADSRFALQLQLGNQGFSYLQHVMAYYRAIYDQIGPIDVIPADSELTSYHILVAPTLFVLKKEVAENISKFVYEGGMLITTFRTGVKDEFNRVVNMPLPGLLSEVCGVTVEEYHSPLPGETNLIRGLSKEVPAAPSSARVWLDILQPTTAEVIAEYITGIGAGKPAITRNKYGEGTAVYIGTWVERHVIVGMT